jgi:hypothetical protein
MIAEKTASGLAPEAFFEIRFYYRGYLMNHPEGLEA